MDRRQVIKFLASIPLLGITTPESKVKPLKCDSDFSELYISKEACEDIKNWSKIDQSTKNNIFDSCVQGIEIEFDDEAGTECLICNGVRGEVRPQLFVRNTK